MLTAFVFYLMARSAIVAFLTSVYSRTEDIYAILAIVIFMSIALTFVKSTRRYAWMGFAIAIILYVAIGFLAPYLGTLTFVMSLGIALIVTLAIKRPIWRVLRRDSQRNQPIIPVWGRLVLQFI